MVCFVLYSIHKRLDCFAWKRSSYGLGILGDLFGYSRCIRTGGNYHGWLMVHSNNNWIRNSNGFDTKMVEEKNLCKFLNEKKILVIYFLKIGFNVVFL